MIALLIDLEGQCDREGLARPERLRVLSRCTEDFRRRSRPIPRLDPGGQDVPLELPYSMELPGCTVHVEGEGGGVRYRVRRSGP